MKLLRDMPLKRRILLINVVTTGIALLLAGVVLFAVELWSFRKSVLSDLTVKTELIGTQSSAALLFNDQREAEEILSSLRADRHVEAAALYGRSGALFGSYRRTDGAGEIPRAVAPPDEGHLFTAGSLRVTSPILLRGNKIGWVMILSDLQELYALLFRFGAALLVVMIAPLAVAAALARRLQRSVTGPIDQLVGLMLRVTREGQFSLRATLASRDELGALGRGFNEMLSTLESRDHELAQHRQSLENTVTDLRRSTEELQAANQKLKELDRLKSDFISVVSHELRTPITSIKAFTELMLMKPGMPAERKSKLLTTINRESDRLARLINDLLDLSKIEAGRMAWHIERQSIEEIVQRSLAGIAPLAAAKRQILSAVIAPDLPVFLGDGDRLVQVATNLLSNAVKFTPEGGRIEIRARLEANPASQIVVEVMDTGVGIPPQDIDMIFERFCRSGDVLTTRTEGSGLGLSIAREIVEYHGGRIWANSAFGAGSILTFTLPLDKVWPEAAAMEAARGASAL